MTAISELAAFVAALDPQATDAVLMQKLKDHFLDTIGVACAGASDPEAEAVAAVVRRWRGVAEASVIGRHLRLPAPKAAFLNALHARILTFDDTYEAGPTHPGSAVVAAALAVAERTGASGRVLVAALLAGYEVSTRVSAALGPQHYRAGFHATGTSAPFGAAAAAARVLGLDENGTAAALGLAGEAAIGFRQYQEDGSLLDSALNAARGAELGVMAAEFAAAGLTGPLGILDGRFGLLHMLSRNADPAALVDGLGERWIFAETSLKPFASCRFTHGPIAALRDAGLAADEVADIEIATFRESRDVSDRPDPKTRAETILSHQIAAALALSGRPLMPAEFDRIGPALRELAARVRVTHDRALDALRPALWPHRIAVRLRDGRLLRLTTDHPPAATRAEAETKFRALADPVLGSDRAAALAGTVHVLETVPDMRALVPLLQPAAREAA